MTVPVNALQLVLLTLDKCLNPYMPTLLNRFKYLQLFEILNELSKKHLKFRWLQYALQPTLQFRLSEYCYDG